MKLDSPNSVLIIFMLILIIYLLYNICFKCNTKSDFVDTNTNTNTNTNPEPEPEPEPILEQDPNNLSSTVLIPSKKVCDNKQFYNIKDMTSFELVKDDVNNNNNENSLSDKKYYSSQVQDYCKSNKDIQGINKIEPKTPLDYKFDELIDEYQLIIASSSPEGVAPDDINYSIINEKIQEIKNLYNPPPIPPLIQNNNSQNVDGNGNNLPINNIISNNAYQNNDNNNILDDDERIEMLKKYNYLVRMRNKYN